MNFLKASGKKIYSGNSPVLLRGFGLGGWLLPEGYMWKLYKKCDRPRRMERMITKLCGAVYAEQFWQRYLDSYITEKDIKLIASEGFNSVRLPLNARHLMEKRDGKLRLIPEMFIKLDRLLKWCQRYGIYIILDMHAAPGGQTGQNIDDSEADLPCLFLEEKYQEELSFLWKALAERYRNEPVIAGYDLLNEPVPNFFSEHNTKVLPLYRRLIKEIRELDKKHMIILEGLHWATDFSVFDTFTREEASDNIVLQFHKYWNDPDAESMQTYIEVSDRLQAPLFMGEGGENNNDWYTTVFPLYEQLGISWSFWTYKKMDCNNSPVTFDIPLGWEDLIDWIDGKSALDSDRAIRIFDNFIECISNSRINQSVFHALKREVPVKIPCEAYNAYRISSERVPGVVLREQDPVSLAFANGKTGKVDYRRYGGEDQPEEENLLVCLASGDSVGYLFFSRQQEIVVKITMEGDGDLLVRTESGFVNISVKGNSEYSAALKCIPYKKQYLWLTLSDGFARLDKLAVNLPFD